MAAKSRRLVANGASGIFYIYQSQYSLYLTPRIRIVSGLQGPELEGFQDGRPWNCVILPITGRREAHRPRRGYRESALHIWIRSSCARYPIMIIVDGQERHAVGDGDRISPLVLVPIECPFLST